MGTSQNEEDKRLRAVQRLNYFYAFTVVVVVTILFILLFNLNNEQRQLIDDVSDMVDRRIEESVESDERNAEVLDDALLELREVEERILERLPEDRLTNLEDQILERIDNLIQNHEEKLDALIQDHEKRLFND